MAALGCPRQDEARRESVSATQCLAGLLTHGQVITAGSSALSSLCSPFHVVWDPGMPPKLENISYKCASFIFRAPLEKAPCWDPRGSVRQGEAGEDTLSSCPELCPSVLQHPRLLVTGMDDTFRKRFGSI